MNGETNDATFDAVTTESIEIQGGMQSSCPAPLLYENLDSNPTVPVSYLGSG